MFRRGGCCGSGHSSHNDSHKENHRGSCCGGGHVDHKLNEKLSEKLTNMSTDNVKDPVCGRNVSKADAISREINSR